MTASNRDQPHRAPAYFGASQPYVSGSTSASLRTSSSKTQLDASHTLSAFDASQRKSSSAALKSSSASTTSSSLNEDSHTEHADLAGPLPQTQKLQPRASRLSRANSGKSIVYAQDLAAAKSPEIFRSSSRASSAHRCADPHYPSSALALTLTKSEDPGAIYIDWALDDPENPFNWPKVRRWALVSACFMFTACTAFNGCGYPSASLEASRDLGTTELIYFVGNTTFLFAVSITPLILAPLSEVYGRSPIYLVAAFAFTILYIPQALAKNITTIIVVRWFQGMAASVGNSMVAGSVSDLFHASERGFPMSLYALSVYVAQGVSPYLSSVTVTHASWRIMFWWQAGFALLTSVTMLILLKETRGPVLLSKRAKKLTQETGRIHRCRADDERRSFFVMVKGSLIRPMQYLVLEPVVLSFALWIGFLWGIIFISLEAVPIVYAGYGWTADQQHLALLTIAVGGIIGYGLNFHQEKLYARAAERHGGKPPPEARLYYAAAGAIIAPIGLFLFAWTGRPFITPAVSLIGLVLFNTALFPIYLAVFSYLADVYERYASSALAAQSFLRNTFGATFPLFSQQMYGNLTPKYASTVLAVIAAVLGIVPFILLRYGEQIRKRSRAAMALQREEQEAEDFYQHEAEKADRRDARRAAKQALARARATEDSTTTGLDEEKHIDSPASHSDDSGASTPVDAGISNQTSAQDCKDCNDPKRLPPTSIL